MQRILIKSFMKMQNDIYLLKTVAFEFKFHPFFDFLVYNQKENKVFSVFFSYVQVRVS